MYYQKKQNRFGNIKSTHNGYTYMSKKEAAYAQELDLRIKAGELKEWKRQVRIPMTINGMTVCHYTIDFVEVDKKGNEMYTEIKGFETAIWRLKWKLFEALYPEYDKQVIK